MFKPRFAPLVKSGAKRQTIRPVPKRMPQIGDQESWREWTGRPYWTPQRELAKVKIIAVEKIEMRRDILGTCIQIHDIIITRQEWLAINGWKRFAEDDGFTSLRELFDWFAAEHGLPFNGIIISTVDL